MSDEPKHKIAKFICDLAAETSNKIIPGENYVPTSINKIVYATELPRHTVKKGLKQLASEGKLKYYGNGNQGTDIYVTQALYDT